MIIDFSEIKEARIPQFKGGEKDTIARIYADDRNKIMYIKLEPGASIGLHKHEINSEIIYVLQGCGKVLYDDEQESVKAGECHYCPKGHTHSLINDSSEDLVFFAVVPEQ